MKKYIIFQLSVILIWLLVCPVFGQHKPQYTQYFFNNYLINPAITGIERYTDVKLGYRSQWVGIKGAPETFYITGHMPFYTNTSRARVRNRYNPDHYGISNAALSSRTLSSIRSHHGVGAIANADKTGSFRRQSFELSYAYHQRLGHSVFASAGISVGYINSYLQSSMIEMVDMDDEVIYNSDKINSGSHDITTGFLLYGNKFYLGISICHLFTNEITYLNIKGDVQAASNNNILGNAAYKFKIDEDMHVVPSVLVKKIGQSPLNYDVSFKALYKNRYSGGMAYRNSQTYAMFIGMAITPYLEVGYSYDYGSNQLELASGGSSEIIVGFRFNTRYKTACPIYF